MRRHVRDATWLTADRARAYFHVIAVLSAVLLAGWIVVCLARGGIEPMGYPLGPDFAAYWTAAKLAAAGPIAAVYDPELHFRAERSLFGDTAVATATPFFYPPTFLLLIRPFSSMPYLLALAAWTAITVGAYWAAVRAIWPRIGAALPVLAFPAVLIGVAGGQNGLLSAALLAAATRLLDRTPVAAGLFYGCLSYKPHLAIVVPVALLAWRMWPALLAAAAAFVVLVAASVWVFGVDAWWSFIGASRIARSLLESGAAEPARMTSVFAAAQLWHADLWFAYGAQAISALLAVAGLWSLRDNIAPLARGAALAAAVPLVSPYLFDYDLAVFAVPMAWLMRQAGAPHEQRFLPWEKSVLCAAFILPLVGRGLATSLALPLGPPVSAALFLAVLRRARVTP